MKILIIDDNPTIHDDFKKILLYEKNNEKYNTKLSELEQSIFGHSDQPVQRLPLLEIDSAFQGEEGLTKIVNANNSNDPYAVVFVDIRMPPGWDGIETIKHIWAVDDSIQIVICTAYSDYSWEQTIQELGEKENLLIIKKPFDPTMLKQLLFSLSKKWIRLHEETKYTTGLEHEVETQTEQLQQQKIQDYLTALPNRTYFRFYLPEYILKSKEQGESFALILLDIDQFKLVNESINHRVGDEILKTIAKTMKKLISDEDTLIRLGGDEFIIVTRPIISSDYVYSLAKNCLQLFKTPFQVMNNTVNLTASIGFSFFPQDSTTEFGLLRSAELAMYKAKRLGGNQSIAYTNDLDSRVIDHFAKENDLRMAIQNQEFILEFQPQINLRTGKLVSAETLVRWAHPSKGKIYPMAFIALAEESGLIHPLGEWILRAVCKQMKEWEKNGLSLLRVAVNITEKQIRDPKFPSLVKQILQEANLDPKYLEIELTEETIIDNRDVIDNVIELKNLGVQIALDDFGTGYSSISYFRELPIDRIKIDQSYVRPINLENEKNLVLKAIIAMAKSLNLEIVAEGVETKRQVEYLIANGCDEAQGFYFSKPISAAEFAKKLSVIGLEKKEV